MMPASSLMSVSRLKRIIRLFSLVTGGGSVGESGGLRPTFSLRLERPECVEPVVEKDDTESIVFRRSRILVPDLESGRTRRPSRVKETDVGGGMVARSRHSRLP